MEKFHQEKASIYPRASQDENISLIPLRRVSKSERSHSGTDFYRSFSKEIDLNKKSCI